MTGPKRFESKYGFIWIDLFWEIEKKENKEINTTFEQFGLSNEVQRALAKMNFDNATPVQEQAIGPFIDGKDLLVQAPTGTGKTAAFGIPIMEKLDVAAKSNQVLILAPTRELAIQITTVLKELAQFKAGVRIAAIYGGQHIQRQLSIVKRRPQIIVATPGRLIDHMNRRTIRLGSINTVVLDEADRMLDMGFRDDLNKILSSVPKERQTVLFSATLSKNIMNIASEYQTTPEVIKIKQNSLAVETVKQYYSVVEKNDKNESLVELIKEKKFNLSLVFVNTKIMADKVSDTLKKSGFRSDSLHGDMRQAQRDKVMKKYRSGEIDVLVATDVAARGIDVNNIDAVIKYDIPQDSESYVHRIGRTGRAMNDGVSYTFIYRREFSKLKAIIDDTKAVIEPANGVVIFEKSRNNGRRNDSSRKRNNGYNANSKGYAKKPYRNNVAKAQ